MSIEQHNLYTPMNILGALLFLNKVLPYFLKNHITFKWKTVNNTAYISDF